MDHGSHVHGCNRRPEVQPLDAKPCPLQNPQCQLFSPVEGHSSRKGYRSRTTHGVHVPDVNPQPALAKVLHLVSLMTPQLHWRQKEECPFENISNRPPC